MTERERFEQAWAKRPWITEDESDKDRAWRWWQTALAVDPIPHNLPGHNETMANLDALTIVPHTRQPEGKDAIGPCGCGGTVWRDHDGSERCDKCTF